MFKAWEVAAAMLTTEHEIHYKQLADRIVETGLTELGRKGNKPWQYLGVELRRHNELFSYAYRSGIYRLKNRSLAKERPEVKRAIFALQARKNNGALRKEIKRIVQRNELLERKLGEVLKICGPLATA